MILRQPVNSLYASRDMTPSLWRCAVQTNVLGVLKRCCDETFSRLKNIFCQNAALGPYSISSIFQHFRFLVFVAIFSKRHGKHVAFEISAFKNTRFDFNSARSPPSSPPSLSPFLRHLPSTNC